MNNTNCPLFAALAQSPTSEHLEKAQAAIADMLTSVGGADNPSESAAKRSPSSQAWPQDAAAQSKAAERLTYVKGLLAPYRLSLLY